MLLDTPEHLDTLRRRPELWPNAVEEILRLDSPVQLTARLARNDVELDGVQRRAAASWWWSTWPPPTGIPSVFPDPHRFDIERANAGRHLAFSGGPAFLPGSRPGACRGRSRTAHVLRALPRGAVRGRGKSAGHPSAARLVVTAGHPGARADAKAPISAQNSVILRLLAHTLGEVAAEPVQQPLPRIGRRGGVVARAGVVEECMVGIRFDD